jgi:hypothetical protein
MATRSSRATKCLACARQSGKRDSNPRHSPWQGDALPTELFPRDEKYNKFTAVLQVFSEPTRGSKRVGMQDSHEICLKMPLFPMLEKEVGI